MNFLRKYAKRIAVEGLGWLLVLSGLAALILPGPGLLMLFAGMALLATQYDWAEKRLAPVREAARKGAADSVKSWSRIIVSTTLSLLLIILGFTWGIHPHVPSWWPVADRWWLVGGWGTGGTLIVSGLIALGMVIYSFVVFRPKHNA